MNNIEKKYILEEFYIFVIFGNHWDSNGPTYLVLTETLTRNLK